MEYKENEVAGTVWHRFSRVQINNPLMETPTVMCNEQEVVRLVGRDIIRDVDGLTFPFDPQETFPILNPVTNEPIEGQSGSGMQVYLLVYSYVLHEAKKRRSGIRLAPLRGK